MTTHQLRFTLAFGLAGAVAFAAVGSADAQNKRHKKPTPFAQGESPYARDPGCVVTYDSSGFALSPDLIPGCETAFRRLYPPR